MNTIEINTGLHGLKIWRQIYRERVALQIAAEARSAINSCRSVVETVTYRGQAVYGINTGFGRLAGTTIPADALDILQSNVVLAHAIGSGPLLSLPATRLVLAVKIAALAQGYSGVRGDLVALMVTKFNHDLLTAVPSDRKSTSLNSSH